MRIPAQLKPFVPDPTTWTAARVTRAVRNGTMIGVLVTLAVLLAESVNLADQHRLTFGAVLSSNYAVFAFLAVTVWFVAQLAYEAQLKSDLAEARARQEWHAADVAEQREWDRRERHNTIERNLQFEFARRSTAAWHTLTTHNDDTAPLGVQTGSCSCGEWGNTRLRNDGSRLIRQEHDLHVDAVTLDRLGYAPPREDEPVTV